MPVAFWVVCHWTWTSPNFKHSRYHAHTHTHMQTHNRWFTLTCFLHTKKAERMRETQDTILTSEQLKCLFSLSLNNLTQISHSRGQTRRCILSLPLFDFAVDTTFLFHWNCYKDHYWLEIKIWAAKTFDSEILLACLQSNALSARFRIQNQSVSSQFSFLQEVIIQQAAARVTAARKKSTDAAGVAVLLKLDDVNKKMSHKAFS